MEILRNDSISSLAYIKKVNACDTRLEKQNTQNKRDKNSLKSVLCIAFYAPLLANHHGKKSGHEEKQLHSENMNQLRKKPDEG